MSRRNVAILGESFLGEAYLGGQPPEIPEKSDERDELLREINNRLRTIQNQSENRNRTVAEVERELQNINVQLDRSDLINWIQFSISISVALGVKPTPLAVYTVIGVWIIYTTSLHATS